MTTMDQGFSSFCAVAGMLQNEYLVKQLYSGVDDLEFQKLLSQVLDPEVDGACIEVPQKQNSDNQHADADHVKQLVPFQSALPLLALLSY